MNDWAEFRHFRYLLMILEKQGFRLAAQELNASQPNLTVQARQFQENASIHLFRKSRSGRIRPTETGVAFIALARFLLATRDEVFEALQAIERGEIRSVRFGCSPWIDQEIFRAFCSLHTEMLPACPIFPTHDDTAHLAEDVLSGIIDAAVITLPLVHAELQMEEIRHDRLVVCMRKDDLCARKMSLRIDDPCAESLRKASRRADKAWRRSRVPALCAIPYRPMESRIPAARHLDTPQARRG